MRLLQQTPAEKIVTYMTRLYKSGLTNMSGGNLSFKAPDGTIWITPAGIDKGNLTVDDIMYVTPDGRVHGKHKLSSEYPSHIAILRSRPDLHAVLHAHSAAVVAYSLERKLPRMTLVPGITELCGNLSFAKYAVPGSRKLGDLIAAEFSRGCDTVLLESHGVVLGADSIEKAYMMIEALDLSAKIGIAASMLGKNPHALTNVELEKKRDHEGFIDTLKPDRDLDRMELVRMCRRCCRQRLFTAGGGAFATRTHDGFLVTPHGEDRVNITEDMIVRVKENRCTVGGTPSEFAPLMRGIFSAHKNIKSIAIARPPHIMGFAVTGEPFVASNIPESYVNVRNANRFPFGTIEDHTDRIIDSLTPYSPIAIVENDCVIVTGTSPMNVYDRLETLEFTAESLCDIASRGGKIAQISLEEVAELEDRFNLKK